MTKKIITFIFLLSFITKGIACSCDNGLSVKAGFKDADAVFTGIVVSKKIILVKFNSKNVEQLEYKLKGIKLFKGKNLTKIITIITGTGKNDCGYQFQTGKKYIVYAYLRNKHFDTEEIVKPFLSTNVCRRTTMYNPIEEKELEYLSKYNSKKKR